MRFRDSVQARKGSVGEQLAREWLEQHGFVVYAPLTDSAHAFDFLAVRTRDGLMYAIEVKTKARRNKFPDTGIDLRHYERYKRTETSGLQVVLMFADECQRELYGGKLSVLDAPRAVPHNGELLWYPRREGGIIYFPLAAMRVFAQIPDDRAEMMVSLSTRTHPYLIAR